MNNLNAKVDGGHATPGIALLRRESFGGTLFFVSSGRREYLSRVEFDAVEEAGTLPETLATEFGGDCKIGRVVRPNVLPESNFSAPDTIYFELTRACNLQCKHCLNDSRLPLDAELTLEQVEATIDDLASNGAQEIRFTGGEPMAHSHLMRLIRRTTELSLRCSIGTNGVLITEDKAGEFKSAGLHLCVVSIDGLEETHDGIRGRGAFRSALEGLGRLLARGIDVKVNVVVMRRNLAELPQLVDFFASRGIHIFLRRLILSGRASGSSDEMLSAPEYADLRESLLPASVAFGSLVQGHYLTERNSNSRIPLPFPRKACSAGHRGLAVLPNGKIQTCGFLAATGETSVGRFPDESLSVVWPRMARSRHISAFEENLAIFNERTTGPLTNCLAISMQPITERLR